MKKQRSAWIRWGTQNKRFLIFYKQDVLDLTNFQQIHPGGRKILEGYIYQDLTQKLFSIFPHNKQTTLVTLNKYIIGVNTSPREHTIDGKQDKKGRSSEKVYLSQRANDQSIRNSHLESKQKGKKYTVNQSRKKSKNSSRQNNPGLNKIKSKFDVSIKILSNPYLEDTKPKSKKLIAKTEQIDENINNGEIDEEDISISNMPVLRVSRNKKQ